MRAMHPYLAKDGRIIIITSEVAGFDPMPFNGLYSMSKTALESYAQALRQELNLIGQRVITIRPGAVKTPLADGSIKATKALAERTKLYQKGAKRFSFIASKFMGTPIEPKKLAPQGIDCKTPKADIQEASEHWTCTSQPASSALTMRHNQVDIELKMRNMTSIVVIFEQI